MNELKTPSLSCIEFHMFHATTLQLWIQYLLSNVLVPSGFRVEAYVPWVNRLLISDKKKVVFESQAAGGSAGASSTRTTTGMI